MVVFVLETIRSGEEITPNTIILVLRTITDTGALGKKIRNTHLIDAGLEKRLLCGCWVGTAVGTGMGAGACSLPDSFCTISTISLPASDPKSKAPNWTFRPHTSAEPGISTADDGIWVDNEIIDHQKALAALMYLLCLLSAYYCWYIYIYKNTDKQNPSASCALFNFLQSVCNLIQLQKRTLFASAYPYSWTQSQLAKSGSFKTFSFINFLSNKDSEMTTAYLRRGRYSASLCF